MFTITEAGSRVTETNSVHVPLSQRPPGDTTIPFDCARLCHVLFPLWFFYALFPILFLGLCFICYFFPIIIF